MSKMLSFTVVLSFMFQEEADRKKLAAHLLDNGVTQLQVQALNVPNPANPDQQILGIGLVDQEGRALATEALGQGAADGQNMIDFARVAETFAEVQKHRAEAAIKKQQKADEKAAAAQAAAQAKAAEAQSQAGPDLEGRGHLEG